MSIDWTALALVALTLLLGLAGFALYKLWRSILALCEVLGQARDEIGRLTTQVSAVRHGQEVFTPEALVDRDEKRIQLLRSLLAYAEQGRSAAEKETPWQA